MGHKKQVLAIKRDCWVGYQKQGGGGNHEERGEKKEKSPGSEVLQGKGRQEREGNLGGKGPTWKEDEE